MISIRRAPLCLLLMALAGCTQWRLMPSVPPPDASGRTIGSARVTPRQTGMMVVLHDVQITRDSVIGWRAGDPDPSGLLSGPRSRMALHRDDVLVFERLAPRRGAAAVVGAALTLLAILSFVALYAMSTAGV